MSKIVEDHETKKNRILGMEKWCRDYKNLNFATFTNFKFLY